MTITISLPPELEKLINEKVQSGEYASANEVISESLRLLEEQEELRRSDYSAPCMSYLLPTSFKGRGITGFL